MSDLRVRSVGEEDLGTIFDNDVEFDGEMLLELPILIHGKIKGSIKSSSDVFIGEGSTLEAEVVARRISIKGKANTNMRASERIELFRTARIQGSLHTPELIVQSGARFSGPCTMPMGDDATGDDAK